MKLQLCLFAALLAFVLAASAPAATIGQIDTFQNGTTQGWFAGGLGLGQVPPIPPQVIGTGGPLGAGDQFLEITGIGGVGAGSRIVAINGAQWSGNYLTSGISSIDMDLENLGSTLLTIRLLFEDPMMAPPVDEAVTTFGVVLPANSGWVHASFKIGPSALTAITGDVNTLMGQVILMRIIDADTPSDAVSIVGVLGVDNIAAIPEPAPFMAVLTGLVGLAALRRKIKTS